MNFYPAILIPLAIFTPLFYLNWNRIDKLVDESLFARFLFFGLLLGALYAAMFVYSISTLNQYVDLTFFAIMLFLPILSAGEQLFIITGKYRSREDLYQLSSSLGGAFSFPVAFSAAIVTEGSLVNYVFVAMVTLLAFLTNVMSATILSMGVSKGRTFFYYIFAILVQMLYSSPIFIEYYRGVYGIFTIIPEVGLATYLYMIFFHARLRSN